MALQGLLSGLGNFASSGLGQAAIGAGLGYGIDRLSGGKGGVGALMGGAGGLLNYGSGLQGGDFNFGSSLVGKAIGSSPSGTYSALSPTGEIIQKSLAGSPMAQEALGATGTGLLGGANRLSNLYNENQGLFDLGKDLLSTYGEFDTARTQRGLAESEIDYRNRIAALQEQNYLDELARRGQMESNLSKGFEQSSLSNYYSA